ncbi:MAG: MBOAT family protein [Myxococcales bacterium]|nr:MBOAT family protein [Myxococcales bacterium]MCB9713659.1 MBOAT family protein [Myxococcales bacterium]
MLFNSWVFLAFFAITFSAYLLTARKLVLQNLVLFIASYVFYGWWSWKFLGLIALSTAIDYVAGIKIADGSDDATRRRWVTVSCVSNLGILALFKYFDFFLGSLGDLLALFGLQAAMPSLSLVLPVGISFYTFQSMSYSIDVYRGHTQVCRNPLNFAVYVSFFPQLVAGPIERSSNFLPQVERPRTITTAGLESGLFLILWGLFKKVVVADNAALIANAVFDDPSTGSGAELWLGALAFTIQIYGDFSGYSDIARGLAKAMGFELMVNFKLPYFATSPSDFWRRWHVSLSSWLRDYLYIPLGGNRSGKYGTYRNLMLTMALGGLWHGASWNFVLWGVYHGLLLVVVRLLAHVKGPRLPAKRLWADLVRMSLMFPLTVGGWILFRIHSMADLRAFIAGAFTSTDAEVGLTAVVLAALWLPVLVMQLAQLIADDLLVALRLPVLLRGVLYGLLIASCVAFATGESIEFIYFQF